MEYTLKTIQKIKAAGVVKDKAERPVLGGDNVKDRNGKRYKLVRNGRDWCFEDLSKEIYTLEEVLRKEIVLI
jgi:hypothetical protein